VPTPRALVLLGVLGAGCTRFGAEPDVDALGSAPSPNEERPAPTDAEGPPPFDCPEGAFCDRFDDGPVVDRPGWTTLVRSPGSQLVLDARGVPDGAALLSSISAPGGAQHAYLLLSPLVADMATTPATWRTTLGFRLVVDAISPNYVGGPRIYTEDASGRAASVGVAVTERGSVILEQWRSEGCAECNQMLGTVTLGRWDDVLLDIEVTRTDSAPFGVVRATIAGATTTADLAVPLGGRTAELRFGISHGATAAAATVRFDDLVFVPR
jgi:hypothetical protein